MTWRVSFKDADVVAELEDLPEPDRFRTSQRIGRLEEDPFPPGSTKLKARHPLYRIRSGDYRIIYAVVPEDHLVIITMPKQRKDPAAVSLGRRGGLKKVPKGFSRMDPAKQREIAAMGAEPRGGRGARNEARPRTPAADHSRAPERS